MIRECCLQLGAGSIPAGWPENIKKCSDYGGSTSIDQAAEIIKSMRTEADDGPVEELLLLIVWYFMPIIH